MSDHNEYRPNRFIAGFQQIFVPIIGLGFLYIANWHQALVMPPLFLALCSVFSFSGLMF